MPANEYLIYCGEFEPPSQPKQRSLHLNLHGRAANAVLKIEDISKKLIANLPSLHLDLLEIAMYVYAADSATSRGTNHDVRMGRRWRRNFRFIIPVRNVGLWSSNGVATILTETLGFLSDDEYQFEFKPNQNPIGGEAYFEFGANKDAAFRPDEVILFSGGLDSFAGTVDKLSVAGKSVALVSHRSSPKMENTQYNLVGDLKERVGANRVFHVPVRASLRGIRSLNDAHRSRSFLFAALGAVTAKLLGVNCINFFENGIMSLNLPPVEQVVGARATRTTHPKVIQGMNRLFEALFNQAFEVRNPFIWQTRAEVVKRIADHGFRDMIRHTVSCTRTRDMTNMNPHCGLCWQCIDRQFSMIATGLEEADPTEPTRYRCLKARGRRDQTGRWRFHTSGWQRTSSKCLM